MTDQIRLHELREQCRRMSESLVKLNEALELARKELKRSNQKLIEQEDRHISDRIRLESVIREKSILLSQS